ncbi:hypothetical protein HU200_021773 [Digitaria exilis]|uniref:Alpha/beta hydrolase fold-3 domain-containing protein n=1 Tax=Digitaria exilis TaxID=1010633 RepID=A0A835KEH8_9POAL|nr:hypothetical protein HU200_021773 [Digitaria exilis]
MDPSSEVLLDLEFSCIYKDHHVDRIVGTETVPAGADAKTGVVSKDVVIGDDSDVYVRLYLPGGIRADDVDAPKLRVLVFFHGGGFITMSAAEPLYHSYINSLAAAAGVLVISVNYRLAPEHPFPIGYEQGLRQAALPFFTSSALVYCGWRCSADSFRALKWALAGEDPWLSQHGDLRRVFLAGDSAGGNIVHNVAMMAVADEGSGVASRIEGAVLLHAAFGGKERVAGESVETAWTMDTLWSVICPEATDGVDDPRVNPLSATAPSLRELPFQRLLVVEADGDFFWGRGKSYYEGVLASGWAGTVDWFETMGKHTFFLFDPSCPEAVALMDRLTAFFAGNRMRGG